MSEPRLSSATRTLLRAAKADGPGAAARAKVWANVAGAVGGAAGAGAAGAAGGASTAPSALLSGGAGAGKMLALGTLLGGTVTVGLAAMLLHVGAAPRDTRSPTLTSIPASVALSPAARPDPGFLPLVAPPPVASPSPTTGRSPTSSPTPAPSPSPPSPGALSPPVAIPPLPVAVAPHPGAPTPAADDALAREASRVVEAREALGRGDPQAALRAIHAARMLPSHQLGPEELALEARALRALGKDDQAREVDSTLRKRFPESALAH